MPADHPWCELLTKLRYSHITMHDVLTRLAGC